MPLTIPASHTLEFVRLFLPASPVTVVEVGAGTGELAAALSALGHSVVPIDSDRDAVLTMRTRGLDAVLARWPDHVRTPAHTVVFSRSLHHLPLAAAVKHARNILLPDGRIIVEDFAFADMPETALSWLRDLLLRLTTQGVWQTPSRGFLADVLAGADLQALNAGDHHEVASAEAMRASLIAEGTLIHESRVAYFYRYLLDGLSDAETSHQVLSQVLREETEAIRTGALWPLGRRWVVSP
jgi:SAM-dependent methyltransferase